MKSIKYICPCCGKDITAEVMAEVDTYEKAKMQAVQKVGCRLGGAVSGKINIKKVHAAYTPEKRRAAALKAWETKRRKNG